MKNTLQLILMVLFSVPYLAQYGSGTSTSNIPTETIGSEATQRSDHPESHSKDNERQYEEAREEKVEEESVLGSGTSAHEMKKSPLPPKKN